MLDIDTSRPAETPRDAATVLVLRDGKSGLEVFCVRRHAKSAFMGGVVVFPGGKLDPEDLGTRWDDVTNGFHGRASLFADSDAEALALAVCGCRESVEEAALIGTAPSMAHEDALRMQGKLAGAVPFFDALGEQQLILDTVSLVPFARWVTPIAEKRRFDARFFVSRAVPGQLGQHDDRETTSSLWGAPAQLLDALARGDLFLAPPTIRALEILGTCQTVDGAIGRCAEQSLAPICPEVIATDPITLALPGDPEHSVPDQRVSGPTRFVLHDRQFKSVDP